MSGEDGVVGLNHSSGDLWSRVDGKLEFGFLAVVDRKALHEKGSEPRPSTPTE